MILTKDTMKELIQQNGDIITMENLIEIKNLTKIFGTKTKIKAVDNINLSIKKGETFGLLGPNGAGKTTTVRLLNCILKATSGTATINGYDINKNSNQVKMVTGLLAESPGMYEKLSAYEFLEFMGSLFKLKGKMLENRVSELLELMGLTKRKDHLVEGFSAGMKQKLLLAAALINDPPILFFDEPTSALDPRASYTIKELIKSLADSAGKTIVICSHILPIVEELCDRIGIMYEGKLVAVGTIEQILEQANAKNLEEAFITLTGGVIEKDLFTWRKGK
jgi:ABC-2 type transport system ATP-binding protein